VEPLGLKISPTTRPRVPERGIDVSVGSFFGCPKIYRRK
jgi:hypothetical protein